MNKITIIGITGADGTGKTTFAKMLEEYYGGFYVSVHDSLSQLFLEEKGEVPNNIIGILLQIFQILFDLNPTILHLPSEESLMKSFYKVLTTCILLKLFFALEK